ncbi:hypothetical protein DPEC_G00203800 [Dallia pectoralis]|uniref:Uncharacterized protein n=1 Tax=Dallia pectoralis TaxID=75939 RepID=A0ACC2G9M2_DALPE|nr:hypothetical protein DPEC_G00203800 [Dallia pectoralis]
MPGPCLFGLLTLGHSSSPATHCLSILSLRTESYHWYVWANPGHPSSPHGRLEAPSSQLPSFDPKLQQRAARLVHGYGGPLPSSAGYSRHAGPRGKEKLGSSLLSLSSGNIRLSNPPEADSGRTAQVVFQGGISESA